MIWNLTTNHHHHWLVQASIISWPPCWPFCNHPWFISVCSQLSSRMSLLKSYQIICTSLYKSTNTSHLIRRKSHHVYNAFSVTSEDLFPWPPWLLLFFALTIESFPDSSVGKESPCNARDLGLIPGSGRSATHSRDRLPTPVFLGFPCGSAGKESAHNEGDVGLIPGLGRFPGEGKGYPLQYSCLENFQDCIVHGVARVRHYRATFTLKTKSRSEMYNLSVKIGNFADGRQIAQASRRLGIWCVRVCACVYFCLCLRGAVCMALE